MLRLIVSICIFLFYGLSHAIASTQHSLHTDWMPQILQNQHHSLKARFQALYPASDMKSHQVYPLTIQITATVGQTFFICAESVKIVTAEGDQSVGDYPSVENKNVTEVMLEEPQVTLALTIPESCPEGIKRRHLHSTGQYLGSGANLLYCMNINAKFEFIDQ